MSVTIRLTSFIFFYSLDIRVSDAEIKWPKNIKKGLNFAPHQHEKVFPIIVARCKLMRSKFDTFGIILPIYFTLYGLHSTSDALFRQVQISERLACYLFMSF